MLLSLAAIACAQTPIALVRAPIPGAETVSIQVFFRIGSAYESEADAGVTHLVEHLLFRRGEPGSLDRDIERLGGRLEATTHRDLLRIWCTVPKEHTLRGAEVMRQSVAPLAATQPDIDAEKRMVLQELRLQSLDVQRAVLDLLWQSRARNSGFALPTGGTAEAIQNLSPTTVVEWSRRALSRERMVLVVSGSASTEDAARIRALFDDLPTGDTTSVGAPAWREAGGYSMASMNDILGVGFRSPSPTDVHAYAAWMIAWEVLAGADGAARRAGLVCRPRLDPTGTGTLAALLFLGAQQDKVSQFLRSTDARSPSDALVAAARSTVESRWEATLARPEERGFWEGAMRVWGGPAPAEILEAVRRCTADEVRAVLRSLGEGE